MARSRTSGRVTAEAIGERARLGDDRPRSQDAARRTGGLGPSLAVILERCRGNNEATSAVLLRLVSLGLVQVGVDPNRPDQMILDTQMLEVVSQTIWAPSHDRDRRTGRCREPGRDLDTGIGRGGAVGDLDTGLRTYRPRRRENRSSSCRDSNVPINPYDREPMILIVINFAICRPDTARRRNNLSRWRTARA